MPGQAGDQHRGHVDAAHVGRADRDRAEPAGDEQRHTPDRADDQRLEQAALRIASHHAEREEDREHDAEEERPEHREPEDGRAGEGARIDPTSDRWRDVRDVLEEEVVGKPEEDEEADGQQQDDGEDLAPQRLAQPVAGDRQHKAHDVSPPTASR